MLCPKCYEVLQNTDNKLFCVNCGYQIDADDVKTCPVCYSSQPKDIEECANCGYDFTSINEVSQEKDKIKSANPKHALILRGAIYAATLILIIACLVVCTTPIAFNSKFVSTSDNKYSYVFKRDHTYRIYEYEDLIGIGIFNIKKYGKEKKVVFNNYDVFNIKNRITLEGKYTYKTKNYGEVFLILTTVLFSITSIVLVVINKKK